MQNFMDKLNTHRVCEHHTYDRKTNVQKNLKNVLSKIKSQITINGASYVKFDFTQAGRDTENMWVEVTKVDHTTRTMTGKLGNVPKNLTNIQYQDEVTRSFDDIIDVY